MAEASFSRGESAFKAGRYQEAMTELTKCLKIEKDKDYMELEAEALNSLGMLFAFAGYEVNALDHYLSAYESAQKNQDTMGQVASLLNCGLLYQTEKEYNQALEYYYEARAIAEEDIRGTEMRLVLYCNIQIAQLFCRMGRYAEALRMRREIENYYSAIAGDEVLLSKYILDLRLEAYQEHDYQVEELIKEILRYLQTDEDFIEQIDFYMDICEFVLEQGMQKEAGAFLELLKEKMGLTEFLRLRMRLEELEVRYQKMYGNEVEYRRACKDYIVLYQEHEKSLKQFRKQNLDNIESLQQMEIQKREYEKKSRCDLITGLLNKKAFQQEVEQYLEERSKYVTNAVAFIDIDNFKLINDSYGHLIGDEVIKKLGEKMQETFQKDCILGRFGGDEFVVFFKNIQNMENLEREVEKFREGFSKIGFGKSADIYVTVSIGVSYNYEIKASYQSMLSCADEALEKAKEYGKNRVTFFEIGNCETSSQS